MQLLSPLPLPLPPLLSVYLLPLYPSIQSSTSKSAHIQESGIRNQGSGIRDQDLEFEAPSFLLFFFFFF